MISQYSQILGTQNFRVQIYLGYLSKFALIFTSMCELTINSKTDYFALSNFKKLLTVWLEHCRHTYYIFFPQLD